MLSLLFAEMSLQRKCTHFGSKSHLGNQPRRKCMLNGIDINDVASARAVLLEG